MHILNRGAPVTFAIRHRPRVGVIGRASELRCGPENEDPYAVATLDFGVRYERAVLDWFDNLPPALLPDP